MTEVQAEIFELREKGWTLAAIADRLGIRVGAVDRWVAGTRAPQYPALILAVLRGLAEEPAPGGRS